MLTCGPWFVEVDTNTCLLADSPPLLKKKDLHFSHSICCPGTFSTCSVCFSREKEVAAAGLFLLHGRILKPRLVPIHEWASQGNLPRLMSALCPPFPPNHASVFL